MPTYRYTDPEVRVYHAFGEIKEGDVVVADEQPDHRFVELTEDEAARLLAVEVHADREEEQG